MKIPTEGHVPNHSWAGYIYPLYIGGIHTREDGSDPVLRYGGRSHQEAVEVPINIDESFVENYERFLSYLIEYMENDVIRRTRNRFFRKLNSM